MKKYYYELFECWLKLFIEKKNEDYLINALHFLAMYFEYERGDSKLSYMSGI